MNKSFPLLLLAAPWVMGQGACQTSDVDGDGYTSDAGDCDDSNNAVYPGAPEACDSLDNDCDYTTDEAAACYQGQAPVVTLAQGTLMGRAADENTFAFLGIPYAARPVGELRWKPPQAAPSWTGTRDATAFGPVCPQTEDVDTDGDGETETYKIGDEDCLTVNVWRPREESTSPRPVMVWIHGGSNVNGSASYDWYEGSRMAGLGDVVLISLQYRLNYLGFLYHEALQNGDPANDAGSQGLLDQQAALRWVQANAAAFGGDPDNVTIFGESAGAHDTWALLTSPLSEGLFHHAIAQSGYQTFATPESARATSQTLLETLVVNDGLATADTAAAYLEDQGTAWIHDYLLQKSTDELLQVLIDLGGFSTFSPNQDGYVLPTNVLASIAAGEQLRVPLLLGANRDETKLFVSSLAYMTDAQYQVLMKQIYGDSVEEIEALYPRDAYDPATPYNQFTDIADAGLELLGAEYFGWLVSSYQDTYLYHYTYDELVAPLDYEYGAAHALELPVLFGNMPDEYFAEDTEVERNALSDQMIRYWTCFARTGAPSACDNGPDWPRLEPSGANALQRMVFDEAVGVETVPAENLTRINFWLDYYGYSAAVPPMTVD